MRVQAAYVFTLFVAVVGVSQACNYPPSVWCSSAEIAAECKVLDQCKYKLTPKVRAAPVNFTLYLESLCPDCKRFIKEQLYGVFTALGPSVLNLTLVPYGNAHEKKSVFGKWVFECQHGQEECVGNLIESCAIVLLKDITVYFPLIHCIEMEDIAITRAAMKCAEKLKIDIDPIMSCANGSMGNGIEHQMALKTEALQPPHTYVPWVTLNGVHTEKIQNKAESNLLELICDTYQGEKPPACKKIQERTWTCIRH